MLGVEVLINALRGTCDTDRAQELVSVERRLAEHFGQAPGGNAPINFHLPKAILRVRVAEREGRVAFTGGVDVRYAIVVTIDAHCVLQSGNNERPFVHRQAGLPIPKTDRHYDHHQQQQGVSNDSHGQRL